MPISLQNVIPLPQGSDLYYYSYSLQIPYAGKTLNWDIIFNMEDLEFAPDFRFKDDSFYMSTDLDVVENHVPALICWDVHNDKSVIQLLRQFLTLYKLQHLEKFKEKIYSFIFDQFQTLLASEIVSNDDIEVYVEDTSVHLLINIHVDSSNLPM